jgi:PIN domain nuclease of toxin-antitoxin system
MTLLLDTHTLLWWMDNSKQLGRRSLALLKDPHTEVWISAVCIWEVSIKTSIGRLKLKASLEERIELELEQGFRSLPVTFAHAFAVGALPLHHADPFDRLLIAQAQCENLTLLTADPLMRNYDVRTLNASA